MLTHCNLFPLDWHFIFGKTLPTHASVINVKIYEGYILLTLKKSKTLKQIKFYIVK